MTGDGRRALLKLQFHVPTSQLIEEKSGLGGLGTGVLSTVGVVAADAIEPAAASATTIATSGRNHPDAIGTSFVAWTGAITSDRVTTLVYRANVELPRSSDVRFVR